MKKICVYFIFLIFGNASAMTDDDALIKMGKYVVTCAKEKNVDIADLVKLQNLEVPTKPDVKCILACSYRHFGTLKSDGMFDLEAFYKFAEEMKEGDEKRLENGKKLADICIKVNDEKVSDGEKGCERAVLMYKCLIDHAPKMDEEGKLSVEEINNQAETYFADDAEKLAKARGFTDACLLQEINITPDASDFVCEGSGIFIRMMFMRRFKCRKKYFAMSKEEKVPKN